MEGKEKEQRGNKNEREGWDTKEEGKRCVASLGKVKRKIKCHSKSRSKTKKKTEIENVLRKK